MMIKPIRQAQSQTGVLNKIDSINKPDHQFSPTVVMKFSICCPHKQNPSL
jgi:hypothetical protein